MIQKLFFARLSLLFFLLAYGFGQFIGSNYLYAAGLILLPVYISLFLIVSNNISINIKNMLYPALFFILFIAGLIRAHIYDSSLVGIATIFVNVILFSLLFIYIQVINKQIETSKILRLLMYGYLFYFTVNILLYLIGFENLNSDDIYNRELETIVPWLESRKVLPFSAGYVDTSIQALFVAGLSIYFYKNQIFFRYPSFILKILYAMLFILGIYGMLLGGSRMMILYLLFIIFLLYTGLYKVKKVMKTIVFSAFFFPIIYLSLVGILYQNGFFDLVENLSRGDVFELVSLNNRIYIWLAVLNFLWNDSSIYNIVFGYGYYGQTISGVVDDYSQFFVLAYSDLTKINTHNSFLQVLINYGLLGVSVYSILLNKLIDMIFESKSELATILLLLIILPTSMEAFLAVPSMLLMFFYILMLTILTKNKGHI
ncbi:O-antigen ligase family protein [bacterium]|nr:O-antigen ligase family protein [bacterium]MBU1993800.1 O-antigen ligase family protein [bacterium]